MALDWTTPYSEASIQAGNVWDTARVAAFFRRERETDSLEEWFMLRFRGGA
jgi:hypothetical protein